MVSHRIHRVELEVEVDEVSLGEALIERLSGLRDRRLAPLLDRVFDDLSGPDRLDRIDTLELELGPIALADFDDEFMRALAAALRSALAKRLAEPRAADSGEQASLELLEVYARTGNLPWWADRRDPDPVAAHLLRALGRTPEAGLALLRSLADDLHGLARLARHLDEASVEALVRHVGGDAGLLADLHELARVLARLDAAALESAALESAAPNRTTPSSRVAGSSGARTIRIRAALLAALARGARGASVLRGLVVELAATRSDLLAEFVRPERRASLPERLRRAIEQVGSFAARPATQPSPERPRTGPREPNERVEGESVDSSIDESIEEFDEVSSQEPSRESPEAARTPSALESRDPPPAPTPNPSQPHAPAPRLGPPRPPTPDRPDRPATPDPLESLDIEDAGLVILWPFLERFFANVGLLDDQRRFLDERARMQAIALLSQLAFEDADPPEWRLPLAKLLCGCPPDAALTVDAGSLLSGLPEGRLAPESIEECERLLAAVIANAPILRDTTVASFRAEFIVRPGLLSVREGTWLLEVEQRPHDLVLDRFAWSWSWLELPWMPDPLSVRW